MIETLVQWLSAHADHAPTFVFFLLLLTGFSFPVSEDIVVIGSGVLASAFYPEQTVHLFLAVLLGSYFSDWIAYWIGRGLRDKFSRFAWFQRKFSSERRFAVERFFSRYGVMTLFIGRLIPFGVRNTVFMAAGAGKMSFARFLLGDGIGCLVFSSIVFFLAFRCGKHYDQLHVFLRSIGLLVGFGLVISFLAWYIWMRSVREEKRQIGS